MTEALHPIQIAGTDRAFDCADDDTVMRAAQRAGLAFPYECNVGSCGNCRFELVEGEVDVAWPQAPGWTEKDRQRRRYLGCQSRPRGGCTLKLRLDERYAPRHLPQRTHATLQARRAITHDIAEFRFALERPQPFEPGQYALVQLPGVEGARAYSMSNASGDAGVWEFQVRRTPAGVGSATLFERLALGDRVAVDGPYGMAWLRRDAPRDILCLAGGSGLAPMVSIARGAMHEPRLAGRRLHFLYGARTPADVCRDDMLRALPGWASGCSTRPSSRRRRPAPGPARPAFCTTPRSSASGRGSRRWRSISPARRRWPRRCNACWSRPRCRSSRCISTSSIQRGAGRPPRSRRRHTRSASCPHSDCPLAAGTTTA